MGSSMFLLLRIQLEGSQWSPPCFSLGPRRLPVQLSLFQRPGAPSALSSSESPEEGGWGQRKGHGASHLCSTDLAWSGEAGGRSARASCASVLQGERRGKQRATGSGERQVLPTGHKRGHFSGTLATLWRGAPRAWTLGAPDPVPDGRVRAASWSWVSLHAKANRQLFPPPGSPLPAPVNEIRNSRSSFIPSKGTSQTAPALFSLPREAPSPSRERGVQSPWLIQSWPLC